MNNSGSKDDKYRVIFKQYQSYVYKIVWERLRFTGTSEDAEECVSDIFFSVFQHLDEIDAASLKAYIGTTAKNKAVDYSRKRRNIHISDDETNELMKIPDKKNIEEDLERSEEDAKLYDTIMRLGEPDSTIIIQKYFYDRKSNYIAKELNISAVTVRVRLNRALKKLKNILSEEEKGELYK